MIPAERRMGKVIEALEESSAIFDPFVDGLSEAVRRGGRLLLFGEGRLHGLAQYFAFDVVGRRHRNGMQLPADVLDAASADPQAIARRVGPFDAILAVAATCEEALFSGALETAKARGARIYCLCLQARARVEGKVTVAVDIPEARPHYVPGHLSMILNFLSKRVLAKLGANPLIRPTRLDGGPPRPASPPVAVGEDSTAGLLAMDDVAELVIDLEPDELDLRLVEENAEAARAPAAAVPEPCGGFVSLPVAMGPSGPATGTPPAPPLDPEGRLRFIQFRCKDCREPILAEAGQTGTRARCPFCGRRVKVPHSSGRLYRVAEATLPQATRQVTLKFGLDDCRLTVTAPGGASCRGALADVTAAGFEATFAEADLALLKPGAAVELKVEAPAFLEPLVTVGVVERLLPVEEGRARALLPIHESATRDARAKLARLAELAAGFFHAQHHEVGANGRG